MKKATMFLRYSRARRVITALYVFLAGSDSALETVLRHPVQ
ncbi:MAG: hypothetical protein ABSG59_15300 [Verrucomicrobiota bacterium]